MQESKIVLFFNQRVYHHVLIFIQTKRAVNFSKVLNAENTDRSLRRMIN